MSGYHLLGPQGPNNYSPHNLTKGFFITSTSHKIQLSKIYPYIQQKWFNHNNTLDLIMSVTDQPHSQMKYSAARFPPFRLLWLLNAVNKVCCGTLQLTHSFVDIHVQYSAYYRFEFYSTSSVPPFFVQKYPKSRNPHLFPFNCFVKNIGAEKFVACQPFLYLLCYTTPWRNHSIVTISSFYTVLNFPWRGWEK